MHNALLLLHLMQVSEVEDFIKKLQCEPDAKVKVVTIFGKTGEGKSYTLNHTFFEGCEVFSTVQQDFSSLGTCTNGVWAAFDPLHEIILFDTEGWQGVSATEQLHMRHLLKVSLLHAANMFNPNSSDCCYT
jgi:zinc finger FYVE domain-containing protein 1